MGRPLIKIDKDMCKKAESLSAQGLTMEQIAAVLGMGDRTLYEKQAEYPQLSQAIKAGRAKGVATITNTLFNKAKDGDNTAMIFYLKNRAGWADKVDVDQKVSGQLGGKWEVEIKDAQATDT